MAVEFENR